MYKMISWDLADIEIHFIIRAKVFKTYSQQEAGARERNKNKFQHLTSIIEKQQKDVAQKRLMV